MTQKKLKSIQLIINSQIDYEFRTTVLKSQLSKEDFEKIGELIDDSKLYYLQKFVPSKIYDSSLLGETNYSDEELENICRCLQTYISEVKYR